MSQAAILFVMDTAILRVDDKAILLVYGKPEGGVGGRGGWRRPVDARSPSNMALIGTKLYQNAFQTIPVISIFGEQIFFRRDFSASRYLFRLFEPILEAGHAN